MQQFLFTKYFPQYYQYMDWKGLSALKELRSVQGSEKMKQDRQKGQDLWKKVHVTTKMFILKKERGTEAKREQ